MKFTKPAWWLTLTLLATSTAACWAQDAYSTDMMGPANLRNDRPYQLLFLNFSPESATVLDHNRTVGSIQLDIADNLLIPKQNNTIVVHEDTEIQRLDFEERRGLGHGLEAAVSIPIEARNAGILDKLVADYHNLIGDTHTTPDDEVGRRNVSAYHSDVYFTDASGNKVVDLHPAIGLGDTQLTLKKSLWSNETNAGAVRAGIKLPTGESSELLGSGGVDAGVDVDVQQMLGRRLALFGNLSYVWAQKAHGLDDYTQQKIRHGAFAVEYYTSSHSSWVLQSDIADAGIQTGNYFADDNQGIISIAYKYSPRPDTLFTYAFTENGGVVADRARSVAQVGPDPTITVGFSRYY